MKGIDLNKYKFPHLITNNELHLNEIKIAKLKLNLNQCFLPYLENNKEKRVSINYSDTNNFSNCENKVGKLFIKRKSSKKNLVTFNKKEVENIFEISIENFKNKIFKKKKSNFNRNDFSIFEDSSDLHKGKDTSKKRPDEQNRIKTNYPLLWFKNQNKKLSTETKNLKFASRNKTNEKSIEIYHDDFKTTSKDKILHLEEKIHQFDKLEQDSEILQKDNITAKLIGTTDDSLKEINIPLVKGVVKINWIRGDILEETNDYILHEAFNLDDGSRVLVKRFTDDSLFVNELDIIKSLNHKKILKYINSENLCIFYEYPSNGTLKNFIRSFSQLNDKIIKKITIQLIDTIIYLNSEGIAHQNLKSSNIFIECDGTIKLSNFIYAKRIPDNLSKKFQHLFQFDILSISLIIIEMCTGIAPNLKNDLNEIRHFINQSCTDYEQRIPINIKNFLKSFYDMYNNNEKSNINLIINHEFLV